MEILIFPAEILTDFPVGDKDSADFKSLEALN